MENNRKLDMFIIILTLIAILFGGGFIFLLISEVVKGDGNLDFAQPLSYAFIGLFVLISIAFLIFNKSYKIDTEDKFIFSRDSYLKNVSVKEAKNKDLYRFSKLRMLDKEMRDEVKYDKVSSLEEFCYQFRNFCANEKNPLYYEKKDIRSFVANLLTSKMMILQGMSGTGKTSIALAFERFIGNEIEPIAIQPMWKERSDLVGYYNEFTKKFNETLLLEELYEATFNDKIYIIILDEMNIARVEYYFAEFLSLLEYHSEEERVLEITNDVWNSDPKKLIEGRLPIGHNVYFIGTANNDESTFAISDKVYDRSMIINLNKKAERFYADEGHPIHISNKDFMYLANEARINFSSTDETKVRKDIEILNSILLQTLRISFGNRMVKQILDYIPVYEACGGTKEEAFDDFVSKKILRKIEGLDFIQLRDSIGTCLEKINQNFKKGELTESKEYLAKFVK